MHASILLWCMCSVGLFSQVLGKKLYSHIQPCKRDQNTISECAKNVLEKLRPDFIKGIPELDIRAIEPLKLDEFNLSDGPMPYKVIGRNVSLNGLGAFKIKHFHVDLEKQQVNAKILIPKLTGSGKYDVDIQILVFHLKGAGNITGSGDEMVGDIILPWEKHSSYGTDYLNFLPVQISITFKNISWKMGDLFGGNKQLSQLADKMLHDNRDAALNLGRPFLEKAVATMLQNLANKVVSGVPYDELMLP